MDPLIGQQLDDFLIQEPFGRGETAHLYKGLDTRRKRPVALRVIEKTPRADEACIEQFEHEARAIANLKHRNIQSVLHFGQHDNLYYFALEYIDGADLDSIIRRYEPALELIPQADVIRVLDEIGEALDYAHGQGVIHRDVKPANIMLGRDGHAILTNFRLAPIDHEEVDGETLGISSYEAPEQADSSTGTVPQSDLYSLGVIAYELLTGALPYDEPRAAAAAVPAPLKLNPKLSPTVEKVLLIALAKEPVDRYQTAAEFVVALRWAVEALQFKPAPPAAGKESPDSDGQAPRRLSLESLKDKVHQELAYNRARGQAMTRFAPAKTNNGPQPRLTPRSYGRRRDLVAYLITCGGAFLALLVFGLAFNRILSGQSISPTTTADTLTALPVGPSKATSPAALTPPSPLSGSPPYILMPPDPVGIPILASTTVEPTKVIAATAIPNLPTIVGVSPTVAFPNGQPILMSWDNVGFRVGNQGGQILYVSNLTFEQLDNSGQPTLQFQGARWARYYPSLFPGACLILENKMDAETYTHTDCPSGVNSRIVFHSGETFWLAQNGAVVFRVLWNKSEIGRCTIATSPCTLNLPPS
jgi:serine/threonine protein kinase